MSYSNSGGNSGWGNDPQANDQQQGWGAESDQPSGAYPASQGSASYPSSQASAGYPASQPSAGYPGGQDAGYGNTNQAYGGNPGYGGNANPSYGDQGGYPPAQPGTGHQAWPPAPQNQDSLFKAIFDFGFTRYATPSVVKVLYILGIIVGGLVWFFSGLFYILGGGLIAAMSNPYGGSGGGGGVVLGILAWIFGLIPLFFWIVGLRVSLEYSLAMVRVSQDSKAIRQKLGA